MECLLYLLAEASFTLETKLLDLESTRSLEQEANTFLMGHKGWSRMGSFSFPPLDSWTCESWLWLWKKHYLFNWILMQSIYRTLPHPSRLWHPIHSLVVSLRGCPTTLSGQLFQVRLVNPMSRGPPLHVLSWEVAWVKRNTVCSSMTGSLWLCHKLLVRDKVEMLIQMRV